MATIADHVRDFVFFTRLLKFSDNGNPESHINKVVKKVRKQLVNELNLSASARSNYGHA